MHDEEEQPVGLSDASGRSIDPASEKDAREIYDDNTVMSLRGSNGYVVVTVRGKNAGPRADLPEGTPVSVEVLATYGLEETLKLLEEGVEVMQREIREKAKVEKAESKNEGNGH